MLSDIKLDKMRLNKIDVIDAEFKKGGEFERKKSMK